MVGRRLGPGLPSPKSFGVALDFVMLVYELSNGGTGLVGKTYATGSNDSINGFACIFNTHRYTPLKNMRF